MHPKKVPKIYYYSSQSARGSLHWKSSTLCAQTHTPHGTEFFTPWSRLTHAHSRARAGAQILSKKRVAKRRERNVEYEREYKKRATSWAKFIITQAKNLFRIPATKQIYIFLFRFLRRLDTLLFITPAHTHTHKSESINLLFALSLCVCLTLFLDLCPNGIETLFGLFRHMRTVLLAHLFDSPREIFSSPRHQTRK